MSDFSWDSPQSNAYDIRKASTELGKKGSRSDTSDVLASALSSVGVATATIAGAAIGGTAAICLPLVATGVVGVASVCKVFTDSSERKKEMEINGELVKYAMDKRNERQAAAEKHAQEMKKLDNEQEKIKRAGRKCAVVECGGTFETDEQLMKHYQQCHLEMKSGCPYKDCGAFFANNDALCKHIDRDHKSPRN